VGQFIGLDVGYGFVKVTDGESGYAFPSVIGNGHTKSVYRTFSQPVEQINHLRLGVDEQLYFVGKSAVRHSAFAFRDLSTTRTVGGDLKILFLAALSLFCSGPTNKFRVVTGLPPGRMYLMDELVRQFTREHTITLYRNQSPEEVSVAVTHLEVVPQPLGTYWSQALDLWGRDRHALEGGRIGVIDIGFRTTDLAAIEDGEFIPENSCTVPVGMAGAYSEIGNRLLADYGLERETFALDEAVIKGRVNIAGRTVDISELRDAVFQQLATKILVEIMSKWRVPEFDHLLLSGGGGQALSSYLLPQLVQGELISDSFTANSKGYLSWANRLWGGVTQS
jgi:plasmid segregation protein ParM